MPIDARNIFTGLNLDDSYYSLAKTEYIDSLNITKDAVAGSKDKAITNIVGNRLVEYTFPTGFNRVIGAKDDLVRNRVIYFVWNSNNQHSILKYDNSTRTITKILESITDTDGTDILEFSLFKKIIHIEIIHRDDEGDLLFWTDGNVSPKGCIIDKLISGAYGVVKLAYIEAAKRPPLQPAVVTYGNDSSRLTNSLRRKIYQAKYRWQYDDYSKSTWSPWSEVPIPANLVNTDDDLDATKNNYIATTVTTGEKNVTDIEIAFRESIGNLWDDPFLTITLNKSDLGISDNVQYQYNFYNDGIYPSIDVRESNLLFDWFPLLAKAMVLANGNVLVYGAITEGYDKIPQTSLDVEMSVELVRNTGADVGDAAITYVQPTGTSFIFTVTGAVLTGAVYYVYMDVGGSGGPPTLVSNYTALAGDDTSDVALGLYNSTNVSYQTIPPSANVYTLSMPALTIIDNIIIIPGSGSSGIASATGWPWYSKYRYGLVYFNEHSITNGVHTYVNAVPDDNDFEIETGNFSLDGSTPKTAVINASINHLPPSWATKYCWVRTKNLTFDKTLFYVSCDFQSDTDYYYFGLQNIKYYFDKNNKFIYSDITSIVGKEDRIRVISEVNSSGYTGNIWNQDYEIQGVVERQLTGGTSSDLGQFIKVKKPLSAPSPTYTANMLVLVYTPAKNSVEEEDSVYWEFSQFYDIYEDGGVNYHRGQIQDQTAVLPATFQFINGDYYYRQRTMFTSILGSTTSTTVSLFDVNYNDFFPSAVNSNGRPEVIEINAKQTYFPVTVRFGQAFQQNTSINELPRFYPDNLDDYNRDFGDILKLRIRDQYMKVGQKLKIGAVPVNLQIIKTATDNSQVTISDSLLNPIQYYSGEFGVGDAPEAWTSFNFADYFCDTNRGVICRLSLDGITPISVLYKVNSWATEKLPLRTGDYKIYGTYDQRQHNYIIALEATNTDSAATMVFDEEANAFEGFLSYHPEMMVSLGTLLITFKDGQLWTHDSTTYNSFYGTTYESYVIPVFNISPLQKKTWIGVTQASSTVWDCPEIISQVNSSGIVPQQSALVVKDFKKLEGQYSASFKRDKNSRGGKINGAALKGNWLKVKFRVQNASNLITLDIISVKYIDSPLNVVQ